MLLSHSEDPELGEASRMSQDELGSWSGDCFAVSLQKDIEERLVSSFVMILPT